MTTVTARLRPLVALAAATAVALTGAAFAPPGVTGTAQAAARTFALVGSLQSELGCTADWQPECAASELLPSGVDGVYAAEFSVPAGTYEYKVAVNDTWDEAYGIDGGADNAPLVLAGTTTLRFAFDDTAHRIAITPVDLPTTYTAADDALVAPPVRQPGSAEQFYFVMTDRFANGDTTNDTGGLTGDALTTGFDPTNKGFYNGGDLTGLKNNLDYIEGLGTTAIWLTPSFKNKAVQGTGANASAGYHGYWITDFTQIDPHLGTNAELEALIADAHTRGIKVYFDIITNHTADVIDYTQGKYDYLDQATAPYKDATGNTFDPSAVAGTPAFPAMDAATSFPYTPTIAAADTTLKVPAWLNDPTLYHNRGNSTWAGESVTYGDFDGLDDLMTENPTVVNGFVDVYDQWVDLGIDGFRIDTVKHVNLEFWQTWTTKVLDYAHAAGKPDFFMFGEVYDADAAKTSPYVRKTDMSSVLDFAFQAGATGFAQGFSGDGLSKLFASDDYYTTPDSSATALPTFLGNHDMGRVGYFVKGGSNPLARSELAHSLMYFTRGQPVVYYGDEQGFVGDGNLGGKDKDSRQSMFASQIPEYSGQKLLTGEVAGAVDRFDTTAPLYQHIAALSALRETTPALSRGAQIERFSDATAYAFSRVEATEKIEHLVALNNSDAPRTIALTTLTPDANFSVLYGETTPTTSDAAGQVTVTVPALSAVVLVADKTVAAPAVASTMTLAAPTAGAAVGALVPVTAEADKNVWQQTSFSYRVAGDTAWTALGTAETGTPRVFHDVSSLAKGTLVEYRAVSVDAAGAKAAASTFASVGVAVDGALPPAPPVETGPKTVTVAGDHNSEMGCASDWMPLCTQAQLTKRADGMYAGTYTLPAGTYQYKVAIDGAWDINYGVGGVAGGDNATYTHAGGEITFYYDPITHYFTSSVQGPILTLPGSAQSEVGCAADWMPDCLAAWLQDLDGDGVFTYTTQLIPSGTYETKVAHNLGWTENYGADGVLNGGNIAFSASTGKPTTFSYTLATHLLTIEATDPPLPGTGESRAQWIDASTIAWPSAWVPTGTDPATLAWKLHATPDAALTVTDGVVVGASALDLAFDATGLTAAQVARFPALTGSIALKLPAGTDRSAVEALLTGELLVAQYGADASAQAITGVQIPGVVDDLFAADAADAKLGATWKKGKPSLALWAPTAQKVDLLLWAGDVAVTAEPQRVAMTRQADGSWTAKGAKSWTGAAYRYEVTVYAPTTDKVEVNQVTDPYSVALTTNSTHSVLVDLADKAYRPKTWEKAKQPVVKPVDQTIYELHVRDFSINDATVPAPLRGTYGAFATNGSGRQHLRELEHAGLTTVHLLPTFDIATIEEDRAAQAVPAGDLASFAPDSDQQQAAVGAVAGTDGFNWGYDPLHFSTPEGSYAVNPNGGARVAEFRTMVGALHSDGLQVVLDQVFNHTAASGQDPKSILDRVVPGYYQRLNAAGAVETSTCCQNVATEHQMAEKLMVDSVVLWARDYKVDGFRFDLMGHHSTDTMMAVRSALDALTVRHDGVDGKAVYLYGEGWDFGEVAANRLFQQAKQGQLGGTGIGTFSDRLRDGVRGGGPFDEDPRIQGFGSGGYTDPNGVVANGTEAEQLARVQHDGDLVRLGLAGNLRGFEFLASDGTVRTGAQVDYNGVAAGYADSPEEVISYVDAHDNETLFDSLMYKLPVNTSMDDRVRMNTLSLATTALAQTPSFWHAGSDLLRSKSLDRNSYDSGDWFNSLDFTGQDNGFGRGLPPTADNKAKWPIQGPLLADPALKPAPADIATAAAQAEDLLRLRFSTPLFRLGSAALIEQKVTFPDSGPDAAPGVIVMRVDDTVGKDVDKSLAGMLVVFNASDEPVTQQVDALAGHDLRLSPVQARGADAVVHATAWTKATGEVTVPPRTVAVLTESQPKHHGHWWDWF